MHSAGKTDITSWLHENQYTYGNLALKREDKPNRPRQAGKIPWYQRTPRAWFRPLFAAPHLRRV